jgi:hypothetical protein
MALFGFQGRSPGPFTYESLLDEAKDLAGLPARVSRPQNGPSHGSWGAHVASDESVTVVVHGRPDFAGEKASAGDPPLRLLEAYRLRGRHPGNSLQGHFALVIIDTQQDLVVLSLGPMGVQRLTYAVGSQWLVFGESAESFTACPPIAAPLSNQGIYN